MTIGLEKTRELRRAYYAAVSFVDSELGRVINEVVTLVVVVMMMITKMKSPLFIIINF